MKAVCISIFNHYENRVKFAEEFLSNKGYDVTYIASDFNHYTKKKYKIDRQNVVQVKAKPYYKNISPARLISHYFSARETLKELKRIKPDLIYVMIPPNSLAKIAAKYRKHNKTVLLFDLYDLWPETFPSSMTKSVLKWFFRYWKCLRDNSLYSADYIIAECSLYTEKLKRILSVKRSKVLHLTAKSGEFSPCKDVSADVLNICYLGSINNIIDINAISALLGETAKLKPVVLHIIGDGESRNDFISSVSQNGVTVEFHGPVYDSTEKHRIFNICVFGINMIKNATCIGLTMKSVDYFEAGLPLLNNVGYDTQRIIDEYGAGINISGDYKVAAEKIAGLTEKELLAMRMNTRKAFENYFSHEVYTEKFNDIFNELSLVSREGQL